MKPALVFAIGINAALERFEIRKKVAVSEDNAARFGGGARSEQDLRDVIAGNGFVGESLIDRGRGLARMGHGNTHAGMSDRVL